jgi:hypothetical protein
LEFLKPFKENSFLLLLQGGTLKAKLLVHRVMLKLQGCLPIDLKFWTQKLQFKFDTWKQLNHWQEIKEAQ